MKAVYPILGLALMLASCGQTTAPAAQDASPLTSSPVMAAAIDPARLPAAISYPDLARLLAEESSGLLLLDVRTQEEFLAGHIPGAILAPYDALISSFKEMDTARPIVVYCQSGRRSGLAKSTLTSMGYTNVSDFGGIPNWKAGLE
ncbi:MAG: rhodanese-like domain-containing protein [Spirochaetales bacterium]|nr:MAG: rhodanese-like domain-containing protein [Spirochaetales bacterium]